MVGREEVAKWKASPSHMSYEKYEVATLRHLFGRYGVDHFLYKFTYYYKSRSQDRRDEKQRID